MVVLLVDPDLNFQFFVWKSLRAAGYTVLSCAAADSAMEASRNHLGRIDVLLTEMNLHGTSGVDLCRTLAAERPEIKALVMSREITERERGSVNGFRFIQKPFSSATLLAAIGA